jgi:hypothetical protein
VKRAALLREIQQAAKARGMTFELLRSRGPHDVYRLGKTLTSIPRHREVGPKMAFEIRKQLQPELGERWWL